VVAVTLSNWHTHAADRRSIAMLTIAYFVIAAILMVTSLT
jgi:hypothetical protein